MENSIADIREQLWEWKIPFPNFGTGIGGWYSLTVFLPAARPPLISDAVLIDLDLDLDLDDNNLLC